MIAIKNIRETRGLTQVELAIRANATQQAISNYETGYRLPNIHTLKRIAKALNVTVDELLKDSDNEHSKES